MAAPNLALGADARLELSVSPERVVIESRPDGAPITQLLTVSIIVTVPAELRIGISDVVAGPNGGLTRAPLGSTPYSLGTSVTVNPGLILVDPTSERQTFKVTVTVKADASEPPHIGMLEVSLFPRGTAGGVKGAVMQGLAMASTVLSGPPKGGEAAISDARVSLEARDLTAQRGASWTAIDQLIPDLAPALVDHGPANAVARFANTGNVILDSTTTFQFSSVGPLALLPGNTDPGSPFYTVTPLPDYALPGQVTSTDADTLLRSDDAAPVDMLPFIGVVRITATTTGTLGSLSATPIVQSTVIVIFPWKELLALVLLLVLLRVLRALLGRGWRRLRGRGKGGPTAGATGGSGDFQAAEQDSGMADRLSNF